MCPRNNRFFENIILLTVIFIFTIICVGSDDPSNGHCEKVVYDLKNCACIKLLKEWTIKCDEDRKMCYDVFGLNLKENNSKTTKRFETKMENILIEPYGRNMNNYSMGLFLISQEEFFKQIGNGYFLEDILWNNLFQNAFRNQNETSSTTSCYGETKEIPLFKKKYPELNCAKIVNGDGAYIREKLAKNGRRRETEPKMEAMDCPSIIERHNLDLFNSSDQYCEEERQFPIAFVRTVFKDYRMLENEFAISYAPQNFYCYAIDAKSPDLFHRQINELAQCFPNVFVLSKEKERKMDSSGLNQIYSAVECLKLIAQPKYGWKYAIILQNHDVQLKTNQELVQIFKWMNGTNDIQYTPINVRKSFYDAGDWTLANLHLFKKESLNARRDYAGQLLSLRYSKGYFQVSLSRAFVNWMLENLNLGPILDQLNTFYGNDEHFWGVLSANEFMEAPGGFTQKCFDQKILAPGFTRFSIWDSNNKLCQSGLWRHGICILGLEDVAMLRKTPYLFANKMMPEMDAGAIECIHEMIYNRTHFERGFHRLCPIYYAELPQVRYNRDKSLNPKNFDVNKFNCCYKLLYSI